MQQTTPGPAAARPNHRRSRRLAGKASTKVRCHGSALGTGPNIAVSVLDLSETGVRLLLKSEVKEGQAVEVTLEGPAGTTVKRVAQVVWVLPTLDGRFSAGLRFDKAVPYASLPALSRF